VLEELPTSKIEETSSIFLFQKTRDLHPMGLLINPGHEFAEKYFDETDETILTRIQEFADAISGPLKIKSRELKKWKYSVPLNPVSIPFIEPQSNLILMGDAFASGGVHGALTSAQKVFEHLAGLN
jgi:predicted NAD/FAD-dependent oxidoreductase